MNTLATTASSTGIGSEIVDNPQAPPSLARFMAAWEISQILCKGNVIPAHLRTWKDKGKIRPLDPDVVAANVVVIVNQALMWGMDPYACMCESYLVHGKLAFQGKLVAAVCASYLDINLSYEFDYKDQEKKKDLRGVTVYGTLRGEPDSRSVYVDFAKAKTDNDMWKDDPEQKICYTGAIRWARRHCPAALLGIEISETSDGDNYLTVNANPPNSAVVPIASAKNFPADPEMADILGKSLATDTIPSAADFARLIDAQVNRADLTTLMARVKESNLSEEAIASLVNRAKGVWDRLKEGQASENTDIDTVATQTHNDNPSESYERWSKSIATETDREQLLRDRHEIEQDSGLSQEEIADLLVMVDGQVRQLGK